MAQQENFPDNRADLMEFQLAAEIEELELSEDQTAEYLEISRRYGKQMKALKNSPAKRMDRYQEFKSIRKNKNREMKALLNEDQYRTYKEIQERKQQEMKQRRLGRQ